jgi:hypothetical protein
MRGNWFDTTADIVNEAQGGTSHLLAPPFFFSKLTPSRRCSRRPHRPQDPQRQRHLFRPTNIWSASRPRRGSRVDSCTVHLPGREKQREVGLETKSGGGGHGGGEAQKEEEGEEKGGEGGWGRI